MSPSPFHDGMLMIQSPLSLVQVAATATSSWAQHPFIILGIRQRFTALIPIPNLFHAHHVAPRLAGEVQMSRIVRAFNIHSFATH